MLGEAYPNVFVLFGTGFLGTLGSDSIALKTA